MIETHLGSMLSAGIGLMLGGISGSLLAIYTTTKAAARSLNNPDETRLDHLRKMHEEDKT